MSEKLKNVPKLRFPEFKEAWEQKTIKDSFLFIQNNTLSRAELSTDNGCAKNVHYGDVLVKYGEYLDVSKTDLPYIKTQSIIEKYEESLLQDGDIIMADTAEDETVGKCTEIAELNGDLALAGLHTIPMRPKANFASGYLGYYMNSKAYHDQLFPLMQGIKVTSVSKSSIQGTYISFPRDITEQEAIGKCFIQLDTLISLQQRKLDQIKEYKKGMLQKMFPKEGESVPEVRFPGFSGEWERKKLADVSEIVTGTTPPTKDKDNYGGDKLFVSPADIQDNRYVLNTNTTLTDKGFALGRKLRDGTSLFVSIGSTIGKVAQLKYTATTNQQINAVIPNDEMDDNFVFTMLENEADSIRKLSAQQAVPIINKSSFGNVEVVFPQKAEQIKIGNYFENLDTLITLHQRKLEAMKEYKKGLLQQMFV